jgi:hypothetical protein
MKNLKSKLRLSLCLLIVCFSTFAQTDSHDCEIVVTRADLEKCATYKRQNEFLEKEVKLQAVEAVSLRDTIKARDNSLIAIKKSLNNESESKLWWRNFTIILAVIIVLLLCLIIFGHKLAKFILIFCLFSAQSFAQPDYRPPFSLNGQKNVNQKIRIDTIGTEFLIESANDVHTIKIPKDIVRKPSIQCWSTGNNTNFRILETHPKLLFILRDSVNIILPSPSKSLIYDIYYLGAKGGISSERFMPYDATTRISFSDTVNFYNPNNQITYYVKHLDHLSNIPFRLKPFSRFGLIAQKNKWYFTLNDFEY